MEFFELKEEKIRGGMRLLERSVMLILEYLSNMFDCGKVLWIVKGKIRD